MVQIWFEVQLIIKYYICSIQTLKMYKTCLLQKVAIVIALALPAVLNGQVPVDISSQKTISAGKVYYMHPVLKGQTLYSISRAYKVTIDDITRINVIPPNGIQTEQVLKIPASEALTASQPKPQPQPQAKPQPPSQPQSQPKPRTQSQSQPAPQSQSQPALATAQARTTEHPATQTATQPPAQNVNQAPTQTATKPESQPQTQPQTQPEAQPAEKPAVKKPVKAAKPESHKVQRGESLSSIARDHGVTERELKKANKGLLFPMPGMYLVIPVKQDEEADSVNREK
jgi:LysM repeat protein